jgi:hypothetical protein
VNDTDTAPVNARPARLLLRAQRTGVIATHSDRFPGFPFGSAVPYAVDPLGRPIVLISDLAAHTQNIAKDARVSLCVHAQDVLTGQRVTLVGHAQSAEDDPAARDRYFALFPEALQFASFGDFHLFRIHPEGGHYIGGFGDIRWFSRESYLVRESALNAREAEIVAHMNADHVKSLKDFTRHFHGFEPAKVQMLTVDCDGFDLRADNRVVRIPFADPASDAGQARNQLVEMALEVRSGMTRI